MIIPLKYSMNTEPGQTCNPADKAQIKKKLSRNLVLRVFAGSCDKVTIPKGNIGKA